MRKRDVLIEVHATGIELTALHICIEIHSINNKYTTDGCAVHQNAVSPLVVDSIGNTDTAAATTL